MSKTKIFVQRRFCASALCATLLLILKQTLSPDFEAVKNSDILIYEEKNETQSFYIENIGVKGCQKKG